MRKSFSGFTLVEVIIATAIITILLGGFLQLLTSQARVASEESQETSAQTGLISTVDAILPILEEGTLISSTGTSLRFYVPLKNADGKLEITPENKKSGKRHIVLGAGDPGSMIEGDYYELVFQPAYDPVTNEGRPDELISEAALRNSCGVLGVDLNRDNDTADEFVYGTMQLRLCDKASVLKSVSIVKSERNLGGRIALQSPGGVIFTTDASKTVVDITLLTLDIRTKVEDSRIRTTNTKVKLNGANGAP